MIYGAWLALIGVLVSRIAGTTAAWVTMAALPGLAVAALVAIERESAVIDAVRAWRHLRRARLDTRERLRRDRTELADVLDSVQRWLDTEAAG